MKVSPWVNTGVVLGLPGTERNGFRIVHLDKKESKSQISKNAGHQGAADCKLKGLETSSGPSKTMHMTPERGLREIRFQKTNCFAGRFLCI